MPNEMSLVGSDHDSMTIKISRPQVAIILASLSSVFEYYKVFDPEIIRFKKEEFLEATRALREVCEATED